MTGEPMTGEPMTGESQPSTGSDRRRVALNLLWLVPGVVGGSEDYTVRLLEQLVRQMPDDLELTVFALLPFVETYPELASQLDVVVAPVDGARKPLRVLTEATWLADQVRRREFDVVHHAGGTLPVVRTAPSIVTIYDLQPLLFPQYFSTVKRLYLRRQLPAAARQARMVLTISEASRRSIIETLGVDPDRVAVLRTGYSPKATALPEADEADVITRHTDGRPYFVFPAITYPHKNHLLLVQAFAEVVAQRPEALLVLTGGEAQMEGALAAETKHLGLDAHIRRVGRVPRAEVDALIRNATALAFPSRFEGFGLPALEAMAEGTPVVASATSSLPEVVGEAGYLLSPDDPAAWSSAMLRLLDDEGERARLRDAGRERAATFTWTAAVDDLVGAYRKVTS